MSLTLDYRKHAIEHAFRNVKTVLAVCSGKGGVGKTFIATGLAWTLRKMYRVGLLDLDVHGFSTHRFLNYEPMLKFTSIEEAVPVEINGLVYFSPVLLVGERPLPIHGVYRERAVLDILSFVKWPSLDMLIIDMPPGTGDEIILPCRYLHRKLNTLIVSLPDPVSIQVASRLVKLLEDSRVKIIGAVLNMFHGKAPESVRIGNVEILFAIPYLSCVATSLMRGKVPYDECPDVANIFERLAEIVVKRVIS